MVLLETGTQAFVPLDEEPGGLGKGVEVRFLVHGNDFGKVIGGAAGVKLGKNPQTPLVIRKGVKLLFRCLDNIIENAFAG